MSILKNAIDSIQLGVEDFQTGEAKRLTSSVRNFFAGVLLLFKHKLAELSAGDDESLLKNRIVPVMDGGTLKWKGKGKKTVDFQQIKERFENLKIQVDWKALEQIQSYRNDIEHYHTGAKPETVRQYLVQGFVIVRDFIDEHLKRSPRDLLGEGTWSVLVEYEDVYNAEAKACLNKINALKWENKTAHFWIIEATCSNCASQLIRPLGPEGADADTANFECTACGQSWSHDELLEAAGSPHSHSADAHRGGDDPVGECPNCGNQGYDSVEEECAFCGEKGPYYCSRCGTDIPTCELSQLAGEMCGYCDHIMSKDD